MSITRGERPTQVARSATLRRVTPAPGYRTETSRRPLLHAIRFLFSHRRCSFLSLRFPADTRLHDRDWNGFSRLGLTGQARRGLTAVVAREADALASGDRAQAASS